MNDNNNIVPILLVTGFLGSGKTTFLNWLIHTHPELKISLILNEFGDIKLESQFIKEHAGGEVAELANGCMCCVAKSDIPRVINYILDNAPQTQYIIIEASGLSDPDPIHEALQNPALNRTRLDAILCIVDALNFDKNKLEHPIVLSQVGDADIVLVSKVKEAGEDATAKIIDFIKNLGTGIRALSFTDDLSPKLFLDPNLNSFGQKYLDETSSQSENHTHIHETMDEYWFKSDAELDIDLLVEALNDLPPQIIRAKGFINLPDKKVLIQYVGGKLELNEIDSDPENPAKTAILFLGQKIDRDKIYSKMKPCEKKP